MHDQRLELWFGKGSGTGLGIRDSALCMMRMEKKLVNDDTGGGGGSPQYKVETQPAVKLKYESTYINP